MNNKLISYLTNQQIIDYNETDIYDYAVFVIGFNLICFSAFLIIGKLFDELLNSIIILLFFVPLRMLIGGYHCKTAKMCFFCSCLMFTSIMIVYKYFNVLIFQNVIIILFITIIVHHHINDLNNRPSLKTFRNTIILLEILLILQKSSVLEHILISWLFVSILYILNLAKQIHKSVKQII